MANFTVNAVASIEEKIVNFIVLGAGFIGNLFVIFVFLKADQLRKKLSNMLIVNQSVIDMCGSLIMILSKIFDGMGWVKEPGPFATFFCRFWLSEYLPWMFVALSSFNLEAITIERYICLIHPIFYRKHFSKKLIWGVIVFLWLMAMINETNEIGSSVLQGTKCLMWSHWPSELFLKVYGMYYLITEYLMPVCIMIFCYSRIVYMLHTESKLQMGSSTREKQMTKSKTIVIRTLVFVALGYFICNGPLVAYVVLKRLNFVNTYVGMAYQITLYILLCNFTINPIIYSFSHTLFQREVKNIFKRKKKQKTNQRRQMSNTGQQESNTLEQTHNTGGQSASTSIEKY